MPVINSNRGYLALIAALQLAHLPFSKIQPKIGKLCQGLILLLHFGHAEPGTTKLYLRGYLSIGLFKRFSPTSLRMSGGIPINKSYIHFAIHVSSLLENGG